MPKINLKPSRIIIFIGGKMITFDKSTIQISPCIVSKAKFALKLKNIEPKNCKKCSLEYWINTINTLCTLSEIKNNNRRKEAINKYEELIRCKKQ